MKTAAIFRQFTMQNTKWAAGLTLLIGGILAFNGFAGLFGAFSKSSLLNAVDPISGIAFHYVVLAVALCELLVAALCLFTGKKNFGLALAIWLGLNLVIYRASLWIMGWHHPYSWLYGLMNSLNVSPVRADIVSFMTMVLLLAGSSLVLWSEHRKNETDNLLKLSCPACGGRIKFSAQSVGKKVPCPHCRNAVTLRKSENLKISCYFCKEHIEFPAHALGQKISCPHCKMDITLKESA